MLNNLQLQKVGYLLTELKELYWDERLLMRSRLYLEDGVHCSYSLDEKILIENIYKNCAMTTKRATSNYLI